jgi:hypothetical protein
VLQNIKKISNLGRFFDTTKVTGGGYDISNLEHSNFLCGNVLGNKFKVLVAKPGRKDQFGGLGVNYEDNINVNLKLYHVNEWGAFKWLRAGYESELLRTHSLMEFSPS